MKLQLKSPNVSLTQTQRENINRQTTVKLDTAGSSEGENPAGLGQ